MNLKKRGIAKQYFLFPSFCGPYMHVIHTIQCTSYITRRCTPIHCIYKYISVLYIFVHYTLFCKLNCTYRYSFTFILLYENNEENAYIFKQLNPLNALLKHNRVLQQCECAHEQIFYNMFQAVHCNCYKK